MATKKFSLDQLKSAFGSAFTPKPGPSKTGSAILADPTTSGYTGMSGGKAALDSFGTPSTSAVSGTGGQSGGPSSSGAVEPAAATYRNDYLDKATALMTQLEAMGSTPFSFDVESDPSYQAAKTLAAADAKVASRNTLETMNDRGITNSSITSSQLGQIEQQAELEPLRMLPQLEANAYNRRESEYNKTAGLMSTYLNTGIQQQGFDENKRQFDTTFGESKRQFDTQSAENTRQFDASSAENKRQFDTTIPLQEAALTGKYVPANVQGLVNKLVDLKTQAGAKGITKEAKAALSAEADSIRNQLGAAGVDPSQFGADVTLSDAMKNAGGLGKNTVDMDKSLVDLLFGITNTYGQMPKGAGSIIGGSSSLGSLGTVFTGLEGKKTSAQQNQDWTQNRTEDQDTFNNNITQTQTDASVAQTNANIERIGSDIASQSLSNVGQQQQNDMNKWMMDNNYTPEQINLATNGYIARVADTGSYEGAVQYIKQHAEDIAADGVNVAQLYQAMATMYPQPKAAAAATPIDMTDINGQALKLAQGDTLRWMQAKTPEARAALVAEYKDQLLSGVNSGK